jgi:hypothetical protein
MTSGRKAIHEKVLPARASLNRRRGKDVPPDLFLLESAVRFIGISYWTKKDKTGIAENLPAKPNFT